MNVSIPAAVRFEATASAVAPSIRRRRGFPAARKVFVFAGVCYVVAAGLKYVLHQPETWLFLACAAMFFAVGWMAGPGAPATVRPCELRFSDTGLEIDVASAGPSTVRYPWDAIDAIDDAGETFVLIPKRGARVVMPKSAFSDGGTQARAFFIAHGVTGRIASPAGAASMN